MRWLSRLLRRVLAPLELVADDGHFREQVLLLDEAVHQAVGFELEGELQVVVAGRQRLEVVGAIDPGRAVEPGPAFLQGLGNVRMRRRALEDHVLQQVGHAGFAVAFVARADEDRQVDGHGRLRSVGKQQHDQAVVEPVFGDALDRANLGGGRLGSLFVGRGGLFVIGIRADCHYRGQHQRQIKSQSSAKHDRRSLVDC